MHIARIVQIQTILCEQLRRYRVWIHKLRSGPPYTDVSDIRSLHHEIARDFALDTEAILHQARRSAGILVQKKGWRLLCGVTLLRELTYVKFGNGRGGNGIPFAVVNTGWPNEGELTWGGIEYAPAVTPLESEGGA